MKVRRMTKYRNSDEAGAEYSPRDEIDVRDLVEGLWDGKYVIIGTIFFVMIACVVFYIFIPKYFSAEFPVVKIQYADAVQYEEFNKFLELKNDGVVGTFIKSMGPINPETLVERMYEQLVDRQIIADEIMKDGLIKRSDYDSDVAYDRAIAAEAYKFEISVSQQQDPVVGENGSGPNYMITYKGWDREKFLQILDESLKKTNESVKENLKKTFEKLIEYEKRSKQRHIKILSDKIEEEKDYIMKLVGLRIEFLEEQAELARALGIEKYIKSKEYIINNNTQVSDFINNNTEMSDSGPGSEETRSDLRDFEYRDFVFSDKKYFLRGYLAIEQEIDQYSSKVRDSVFSAKLQKLEDNKRALDNNDFVDRLSEALQRSALYNGTGFRAALLDIKAVKIRQYVGLSIVAAISLLIGFILGVVILVIRNVISARKAQMEAPLGSSPT